MKNKRTAMTTEKQMTLIGVALGITIFLVFGYTIFLKDRPVDCSDPGVICDRFPEDKPVDCNDPNTICDPGGAIRHKPTCDPAKGVLCKPEDLEIIIYH